MDSVWKWDEKSPLICINLILRYVPEFWTWWISAESQDSMYKNKNKNLIESILEIKRRQIGQIFFCFTVPLVWFFYLWEIGQHCLSNVKLDFAEFLAEYDAKLNFEEDFMVFQIDACALLDATTKIHCTLAKCCCCWIGWDVQVTKP